MSNTYEFYKERYNDIQRHAYRFLNEVPLTAKEQAQIIRKYSLGKDFVTINSVQDYNNDWLIKGYIKVDIRDVNEPVDSIKGKFLDDNTFLKEVFVQIPKELFGMDEEDLKREVYSSCVKIAEGRINDHIATLRMQKLQIEDEIKKYVALLKEFQEDIK